VDVGIVFAACIFAWGASVILSDAFGGRTVDYITSNNVGTSIERSRDADDRSAERCNGHGSRKGGCMIEMLR